MRKQMEELTAAAGARRATGAAAEHDRTGRFSARRKRAVVLRLLRGEDLESVSRDLGITAARASQWRDQFLAAGQAGRTRSCPDQRDCHRMAQAPERIPLRAVLRARPRADIRLSRSCRPPRGSEDVEHARGARGVQLRPVVAALMACLKPCSSGEAQAGAMEFTSGPARLGRTVTF